jgi:predicted amidohydrolase
MIAGYIQTDPEFGNKPKNFRQIFSLATDTRADLLVLPELFATGYPFTSPEETAQLAEPVNGPTARFMWSLQAHRAVVVGGFIEQEEDRMYIHLWCDGETIWVSYRKIHLFNRESSGSLEEIKPQRF